jgi:hypothetical protein
LKIIECTTPRKTTKLKRANKWPVPGIENGVCRDPADVTRNM